MAGRSNVFAAADLSGDAMFATLKCRADGVGAMTRWQKKSGNGIVLFTLPNWAKHEATATEPAQPNPAFFWNLGNDGMQSLVN